MNRYSRVRFWCLFFCLSLSMPVLAQDPPSDTPADTNPVKPPTNREAPKPVADEKPPAPVQALSFSPTVVHRGDLLTLSGSVGIFEAAKISLRPVQGKDDTPLNLTFQQWLSPSKDKLTLLVPKQNLPLGSYLVVLNDTPIESPLQVVLDTKQVTLESVWPKILYANASNLFSFTLLGDGFSQIPQDNVIWLDGTGALKIDWREECDNAIPEKFDGIGVVKGSQQIQICALQKKSVNNQTKLQVKVGGLSSSEASITFALYPSWQLSLYSLLVVLVLLIIVLGIARRSQSKFLIDAESNTYSISKLQFYLWTTAAIFGYSYLVLVRSLLQGRPEFAEIPDSLPGILLISAVTTISAQGVAAMRGSKGAGEPTPSISDLLSSGGVIAVDRVQYLVWTLVGVSTFIYIILVSEPYDINTLPSVPRGFLELMGISAFGYLGGKLVRGAGPVVDEIVATVSNGQLSLALRGKGISKEALLSIGAKGAGSKEMISVTTEMLGGAKPSYEDDSDGFAKRMTVMIINPKPEWLTAGAYNLSLTNPDKQTATKEFVIASARGVTPVLETITATVSNGQLTLSISGKNISIDAAFSLDAIDVKEKPSFEGEEAGLVKKATFTSKTPDQKWIATGTHNLSLTNPGSPAVNKNFEIP